MIAVDKELRFTATGATVDGRQDELIKDRRLPGLCQYITAASPHKLFNGEGYQVAHLEQVYVVS